MMNIGIPAGIQGSLFSISNFIIQASVNSFGAAVIAGNSACVSVEGLLYCPSDAVMQAATTAVSQNVGAHNVKRIVPILWWSSLCVTAVGLLLGVPLHRFIILTVEMDQLMFIRTIAPRSYLLAVALTMLFTFVVCFAMRRHVRHISMVESMKAPE